MKIVFLCMLFLAMFMGIVIYTILIGMTGIDAKTKKRAVTGFFILPVVLFAIIILILAGFFLIAEK